MLLKVSCCLPRCCFLNSFPTHACNMFAWKFDVKMMMMMIQMWRKQSWIWVEFELNLNWIIDSIVILTHCLSWFDVAFVMETVNSTSAAPGHDLIDRIQFFTTSHTCRNDIHICFTGMWGLRAVQTQGLMLSYLIMIHRYQTTTTPKLFHVSFTFEQVHFNFCSIPR